MPPVPRDESDPPAPAPESPASDDDDAPADDPLDDDDLGPASEPTEDVLLELLDPGRWPDEPDDADPLPPPSAPEPAAALDLVSDDEEGLELEPIRTEEAPLPSLADDPVVIPWHSEGLVDGAATVVIADPTQPGSLLMRRAAPHGPAEIRVRLAGVTFRLSVTVESSPEGDRLRLGRDALRGRFLVDAGDR